jgi:hypothetical protein
VTPLTREDQALLCGRDADLRVLLDNCTAGRVTVVSAKPGFGVTSFLEAGARPALEREDCLVVSFRDWSGRDFARNLREKVAAIIRRKLSTADTRSDFSIEGNDLEALLRRGCRETGCRIVLILDQFEDYLRQTGVDITESFDAEIANAVRLQGAAPILLGVQDYALDAFQRMRQSIPNLLGGQIELGPLTKDDARALMQKTVERRHFTAEPAAVEALVNAPVAAAGDGVDPSLFTAGLNRLIEAEVALRSGALRATTIQQYGGPDKLILETLDSTLNELSSTHTELFFRWCNILIGKNLQRQSATEQALTSYAGKLNRFVLTLLPILTGRNILRTIEIREGVRYEIARDRMIPMIRHWWEKREASIIARRRAIFRLRSLSVATATIVVLYVVWLVLSKE